MGSMNCLDQGGLHSLSVPFMHTFCLHLYAIILYGLKILQSEPIPSVYSVAPYGNTAINMLSKAKQSRAI